MTYIIDKSHSSSIYFVKKMTLTFLLSGNRPIFYL